ncbi:MAG: phosphopyruvate hydratase [Acutalibacteraceae bacterium]|nr:phosphopyruvate hydratase [Acutalibacteraceae bacterium]
MNTRIKEIKARQIFDSRSNPTIEAEVILENDFSAKGAVPSGASTGIHEAVELRDGGKEYCGKGVLNAVSNVNTVINELLCGKDAANIHEIDQIMIKADGTVNKSKLGANAILAVSIACVKAAAAAYRLPLYQFIGGINSVLLPVPMMNILNGGAHADNNIDIQEFMIMPFGAKSFAHAMQMGTEIYASLKNILKQKKLSTAVGDEGGFAPNLDTDEQALELLVDAISAAGYKPGGEIKIALDAAASEWCKNGSYIQPKSGRTMTSDGLVNYFEKLCNNFPIFSIEDPLAEDDFAGFTKITEKIGNKVQIVGDDLFVTNQERLRSGIQSKSGNAILIKPNQIGSISETMEAIRLAKQNNFRTIMSHRSGETEDSTIADLAVALNCGQIKTGAPARSDRVSKYNQLLRIEEMLGTRAIYGTKK